MTDADPASKRPREDADGHDPASKRVKAAEEPGGEQQQQQPPSPAPPGDLLAAPALEDGRLEAKALLPALKQLLSVYKVEYWAVLEEMRSARLTLCSGQPTTTAACSDGDAAAARAAEAAASRGNLRALVQAARGDSAGGTAAAGVSAAAATPTSNGDQPAPAGGQQQQDQPTQQQEKQQDQPDCLPEGTPLPPPPPPAAPYGDDRCGHGGADDPAPLPLPAEVECLLLQLPPGADKGAASEEELAAWRERFRAAAGAVAGLEQLASAATLQFLDAQGALACLCGAEGRWVLRRSAVTIGRSSDSKGDVDVDLSRAAAAAAGGAGGGGGGSASRVSRLQAQLSLGADGAWTLVNTGRAPLAVDGAAVPRGAAAPLRHLSLLEVGGAALLFMVNGLAVQRVVARSRHLVM